VRVTDADGNTDIETFSIRVVILPLLVATTSLPEGAENFPYAFQFTLASPGGGSPYAWSQASPIGGETDLAAIGMEITPAGLLRSKPSVPGPSAAGTYTFRVQVVDQAGQVAPNPQRTFTLTINPGPVLQRITPDKAAAGGPFVATGLNFQTGATLTFNDGAPGAQTITPTFVSATELRFTSAPTVPGASGFVPVRVTNPDGGSHLKLNAFAYPAANFAFDSTARTPVPNSTLSSTGIDVADVNNDGFADIVHSGTSSGGWSNASGTSGGVEVLVNAPTGGVFDPSNPTFTKVTLATGDFHQVRFSDQNSDGFPDVVAVGDFSGVRQVRVFVNQAGTGGAAFSAGMTPVITSLPTQGSFSGHVADFDLGRMKTSDQVPDLAYVYQDPPGTAPVYYSYTTWYEPAGNTVATLEGLGDGTFGSSNLKTGTDIFELFTAAGVSVGDYDGDSRVDLHVSDGNNNYSWLGTYGAIGVYAFTDSAGLFGDWSPLVRSSQITQYSESLGTSSGDVTGDGLDDVVVSTGTNWVDGDPASPWYGLPGVSSFASSGDGTFSELSLYNPGIIYRYNTIFDGNFDLALDVAATGGTSGSFNTVDVLRGSDSGLDFITSLTASIGNPNIGRVAAGDVNGDGKPDVVACLSFYADSYARAWVGSSYLADRGDGSTKGVVFFLNASN
jgi:hypothetical protein